MSSRLRVVNVYPFDDADRDMLDAVDPALELIHTGSDEQAWIDELDDPDVEVLSASYAPAREDRTPRLRWLATAGAGIEYLSDVNPWARGLTVTNGSGLHAVAMAEYALGAIMWASERMRARSENHAARGWDEDARYQLAGRRIRGRTLLIVGYGSIGREVARSASSLGMRILAVKADPTRRRDEGWAEAGTGDREGSLPARVEAPAALAELAVEADYVVLSVPLTPRTRGIVDAAVLDALRSDAWIINVGRGDLIDEAALIAALRAGSLGGAVLDVAVDEPLPRESPLWSLPGCFITPHVSGLGGWDTFWHRAALLLAENLRRHLAGDRLLNRTDPLVGY